MTGQDQDAAPEADDEAEVQLKVSVRRGIVVLTISWRDAVPADSQCEMTFTPDQAAEVAASFVNVGAHAYAIGKGPSPEDTIN